MVTPQMIDPASLDDFELASAVAIWAEGKAPESVTEMLKRFVIYAEADDERKTQQYRQGPRVAEVVIVDLGR